MASSPEVERVSPFGIVAIFGGVEQDEMRAGVGVFVPEGRLIVAQHFSAGKT
jgi:hypothetical protein